MEVCQPEGLKRDAAFALVALEEELRYLECDLSYSIASIREEQVIEIHENNFLIKMHEIGLRVDVPLCKSFKTVVCLSNRPASVFNKSALQ